MLQFSNFSCETGSIFTGMIACDCLMVVTIVVSEFEICWQDDVALIEGLWFYDLCKETAIEYVVPEQEYVSPKTAAMGMNLKD